MLASDLENGDKRSGYLDISLNWSSAEKLKDYLMSKLELEFSIENSGDYFEKIRV